MDTDPLLWDRRLAARARCTAGIIARLLCEVWPAYVRSPPRRWCISYQAFVPRPGRPSSGWA